jgi:hypothetical protein
MREIFEYPAREMIRTPSCRCRDALRQSLDNYKVLFALNDGKLKSVARTRPLLDPRPESREWRPPMRACAVDRKGGYVKGRGGQKPNEDYRDGYQRSKSAVPFCLQSAALECSRLV